METHIWNFFKTLIQHFDLLKKKLSPYNIFEDQNKMKLMFRFDVILDLTDVRDHPSQFSVS